jgi:diguanylate cyclase
VSASADHKSTLACANIALGSIKALRVPGDPRSYAAWFTYATNCSPSQNDMVNRTVAQTGTISAAEIEKIFGYGAAAAVTEQVDVLTGGLVDKTSQVLAVIEAASSSIATYRSHLATIAHELGRVDDPARLRAIVDGLIRATRSMEARNETYAASLGGARHGMDDLRDEVEDLRSSAMIDALTRLANRRGFESELDRCIGESGTSKSDLCLLLLDIDRLGSVNDNFGHMAGDQVIRAVSHSLKQHVHPHDVPARVGGEEFAVILPNIPLRSALTVAEQIRRRVSAMQFTKRSTGESMGRVTVSGGVARFRPGETPWTLMQRADHCVTAAKRHGRNRVICDGDALVAA